MDTIFMNSENSKISDIHRLLLNLTAFTIHRKTQKSHTKTVNLKYQLRHGMKILNYPIIFCIRYTRLL